MKPALHKVRLPRSIYAFQNGRADGSAKLRDALGGKGANLADMTRAGLPVPPGFTLTTAICAAYHAAGKLPDGLVEEVRRYIGKLEKATGKRFTVGRDGASPSWHGVSTRVERRTTQKTRVENSGHGTPAVPQASHLPLLVSVRSGAAVSMPGMMETILNVGLNDHVVEALAANGQAWFAFDSYRRLIAMFASAVHDVDTMHFEDILFDARREAGVSDDRELSAEQMQAVAEQSLAAFERQVGRPFPQDPFEQLTAAIEAVFRSWTGRRAVRYREINRITGLAGTAVTVQAMVFGNSGEDSATGVAFTRDPATGRRVFYGEFLVNAQGEDLVAGVRTPLDCRQWFGKWNRKLWKELRQVGQTLEQRYTDVQDFEFTVERGRLYLLQTRAAQRTAAAAVKTAVDLANEGLIDRKTAVARVDVASLTALQPMVFDPKQTPEPIAVGLAASPGAAVGAIAFTAADAEARAAAGERVILVRPETYPDDLGGFHAAAGVLTSTGGNTSHAAVVARGMNRVCVVGAGKLRIDADAQTVSVKAGRRTLTFGPHDTLSIDGSTGQVYAGEVPTVLAKPKGALKTLLAWRSA